MPWSLKEIINVKHLAKVLTHSTFSTLLYIPDTNATLYVICFLQLTTLTKQLHWQISLSINSKICCLSSSSLVFSVNVPYWFNYLSITCFDSFIFRDNHTLVRRRKWHPTPVLLPGKSQGRRSLVSSGPWGRQESDTTEQLHFHFHTLVDITVARPLNIFIITFLK